MENLGTAHLSRHYGRWTLDDRLDRPVREVPFELPLGTAAITVRLTYDRSAGILDLGCEGPHGFRGWSGGVRSEYTITPEWATPGYVAGEVEPGVWLVLIGLHRISLGGVPYEITVVAHRVPPEVPEDHPDRRPRGPARERRPPAAARRDLPFLDHLQWLAGDTHAHTVHSDGSLDVFELAAVAADQGLDFLAVTDHNTVSHHAELPAVSALAGVLLVSGQEITTDLGHANAFGRIGWIDFRDDPDEWAKAVQDRGGVLSINHPVTAGCAWRHPMTHRPTTAELWHWTWCERTGGAPLAWGQAWSDDLVVVGGGDFHRPEEGHPPGVPTTWVLSDPLCAGPDAVVEALAQGRTAVSASPDGPLLLRHGDEFLALGADGLVLWGAETRTVIRGDRTLLPARPGVHRLETPAHEVMALCT